MIISVSRRTDIPSYYMEWFINRIQEGFVYVRNPLFKNKVSNISLKKEDIEFIVFWTKNPGSFLKHIDFFKDYFYYLQITLNSYTNDLEPNLPNLSHRIEDFIKLSQTIGKEKVVWRYDPILFTNEITENYHLNEFEYLCKSLSNYTDTVMISFVDEYPKMIHRVSKYLRYDFDSLEGMVFLEKMSKIAVKHNLKIQTCSEIIDLNGIGIYHGKCIDDARIETILKKSISVKKDKGQRSECSCVESVDIGSYNTCLHGCTYCYANFSNEAVMKNTKKYNKYSPILCDSIIETDQISTRKPAKILCSHVQNALEL